MLITISGASGVGKDTVAKFLLEIFPNTAFLRSFTTREPRDSDIGYEYISEEEFSRMEQRGVFAWPVPAHGNKYGTLKSDLFNIGLDDEKIYLSVLVPEIVERARMYARRYKTGDVLSIYLYCSDKNILRSRLLERGEKDIERRIKDCLNWDRDARRLPFFIWVDNSGDLETTKKEVARLIKEAGFLDLE